MRPEALIFDVDGTLAETEEIHRKAFNQAFVEAGLDWQWDRDCYKDLLRVTGGKERIRHYAGPQLAAEIDVAALHARKTALYEEMVLGGELQLLPGVEEIISFALSRNIALGIATTTSRNNVDVLFERTLGRDCLARFDSIRTGEDVSRKKPDPQVFELAIADLQCDPANSLALEDSANGVASAKATGLRVVAIPGEYFTDQDFSQADHIFGSMHDALALVSELVIFS